MQFHINRILCYVQMHKNVICKCNGYIILIRFIFRQQSICLRITVNTPDLCLSRVPIPCLKTEFLIKVWFLDQNVTLNYSVILVCSYG